MKRFRFVVSWWCAGIALLAVFPPIASAEITEWTGNVGWAPTAWDESVNGTRGVPSWGDEARIPCKDVPYGYATIGQANALCTILTLGPYGKEWGTIVLTGEPSFLFSCLETIGDAGGGIVLHSNGTHHVAGACLLAAYRYDNGDTGEHVVSSGRYVIADGLLAVRTDLPAPIPGLSFPDLPMPAGSPLFASRCGGLFVGICGQGTFEQIGGRVDADWLELGHEDEDAPGSYLRDSADPDGDELNVGHLPIAKASTHTNVFHHYRGSVTIAWRPIPRDPWNDLPGTEFPDDLEVYGCYDLRHGMLQVVSNAVVGLEGTFRQNGGSVSILGSMTLDGTATNQYELRAGTLQADELNLCRSCPHGTFDQWGGTNTVRILRVGAPRFYGAVRPGVYTGSRALGCYLLRGGELRVTGTECCYVGYDGQAFFMHTGDEDCRVRIDHKLYIGYHQGSDGLYSFGCGLLDVGDAIRIGADGGLGRLEWTLGKAAGGRIDTPLLELGGQGTLAIGYNANVGNLFVGATSLFDRATTVSGLGQAMLEVGRGATISQTGGYVCAFGALQIATHTLSIFPPGFAPGMVFKSYSNAGRMHTAGNELKIGGGTNYTFAGCIEDPVRFQSGGV